MTEELSIPARLVLGALIDMPPRKGSEIAGVGGLPMGLTESSLSRLERMGWISGDAESVAKHPLDRRWTLTAQGRRSCSELTQKGPRVAPIIPVRHRPLNR